MDAARTEEVQDARYVVDATGRIVSCNEAFADLVGQRVADIMGRHSLLFYTPEAAPELLKGRIESLLTRQASSALGIRIRREHGEPVPVELRVTRLDEQGRFCGHVVEVHPLRL
jgi:PAS domain S-box-containing protein